MATPRIIRTKTITMPVREANGQYKAVFKVPGNAKRIVGIVVTAKVCGTNVPMYIPRHVFFALADRQPVGNTFQDFLAVSFVAVNRYEKPYLGKNEYQQFTGLVDQYVYYACPVKEGIPNLEINGQTGGFEDAFTKGPVSDSPIPSNSQDYYIFRSTEKYSGDVEINAY